MPKWNIMGGLVIWSVLCRQAEEVYLEVVVVGVSVAEVVLMSASMS